MPGSNYDRIFSKLFNTPWLIEENWLETIIEIANREGSIEAVQTRLSERMPNTDRAQIRDRVAHIPITGPIFPKANIFTEVSGATSVEKLATDFQTALDSDDVDSIILDIDSPGGHVTGINEMANIIRDASKVKDVTAYVSGTGASAAYWLASAAKEVVIDATARVGSIGVVVAYPSKKDESRIEIVSTASPNKRIDPNTEEGKKVVIKELDALADVFISTVAENRGVTKEHVIEKFGRGGVLVGKEAVEVGMADRLGSFEKLLAEKSNYGGDVMPGQKANTEAVVTAESLQKDHPTVYQSVFGAGEAAATEKFEAMIKEKDDKIASLEKELAISNENNSALADRVTALEKNEVIRTEKEAATVAKTIVESKLAASAIPDRLYDKVSSLIDHNKFMNEGSLDVEGFTAAVDSEISDWEDKLEATSPVQGMSVPARTPEGSDASSDVDSIVDRLAALAGTTN